MLGAHRQGSVVRPQSAYLTDEDDMPWVSGSASSSEYSPELDDNEQARERRLRRKALKRKRPAGFAPYPIEDSENRP